MFCGIGLNCWEYYYIKLSLFWFFEKVINNCVGRGLGMCDKIRINKICNRRNYRDRLVRSLKKFDVFMVEWVMLMSKGGLVKDCDV